jgi:hypothetical protein
MEDAQPMARALEAQICFEKSISQMPLSKWPIPVDDFVFPPTPKKVAIPLVAIYKITGLMDIDLLNYIRVIKGYVDACQSPTLLRLKVSNYIESRFADLPRYCLLSHTFLPYIIQGVIKDVVNIARLRAVGATLAVERYRLANGKLPDKLDELVPAYLSAVPTDPFDGQPLRYKKLAKGYVVYSIGENGRDDGGDEKKDITFTVER